MSLRCIPPAVISCFLLSVSVSAQTSIDWEVVGGGTEISAGGVYTVQGTLGQASTGQAQGGDYAVSAGFWTYVIAMQTPGAPQLVVSWDGASSRMRVSWPLDATGWVLQSTDALAGPDTQWFSLEGPYETTDTEQQRWVTPTSGQRYYRLRKASAP